MAGNSRSTATGYALDSEWKGTIVFSSLNDTSSTSIQWPTLLPSVDLLVASELVLDFSSLLCGVVCITRSTSETAISPHFGTGWSHTDVGNTTCARDGSDILWLVLLVEVTFYFAAVVVKASDWVSYRLWIMSKYTVVLNKLSVSRDL